MSAWWIVAYVVLWGGYVTKWFGIFDLSAEEQAQLDEIRAEMEAER